MASLNENLRQTAKRLFDEIYRLSFDGVGITRESYGPSESTAVSYLREFAQQTGLRCSSDDAGNLLTNCRVRQTANPCCCAARISIPSPRAATMMAWQVSLPESCALNSFARQKRHFPGRSESLRCAERKMPVGKAYIGSSALFGKLTREDLALTNSRSGKSLAEAMREAEQIQIALPRKSPFWKCRKFQRIWSCTSSKVP